MSDTVHTDGAPIGPPARQSAISTSRWRHRAGWRPPRSGRADIAQRSCGQRQHWTSPSVHQRESRLLYAPLSLNSHSRAAEHTGRTGGGNIALAGDDHFFFSLSACWLWKTHICGRESQSVGQFSLPSSLQPATSPSQLKRTEEGGFFFKILFYSWSPGTSSHFFHTWINSQTTTIFFSSFTFILFLCVCVLGFFFLCHNVMEISRQREIWGWLRGEWHRAEKTTTKKKVWRSVKTWRRIFNSYLFFFSIFKKWYYRLLIKIRWDEVG